MTLNEAKEEILSRRMELLQRDESGNRIICPICNNGVNESEPGVIVNEDNYFTCLNGCFCHVTILEIMGIKASTNKEEHMIKMAASQLNIEIDDEDEVDNNNKGYNVMSYSLKEDKGEIDYTLFYEKCMENVEKVQYLKRKKISSDIIKKYNIGYCDNWIHPDTSDEMKKYVEPTNRIIIPIARDSYVSIYAGNNKSKASIQRVGTDFLFNEGALWSDKGAVFVTSDEMDALSIIECKKDAISFGGIDNIENLYKALEKRQCSRVLILCMDEDNIEKQQEILYIKNRLDDLNVKYVIANITGDYNNASEAYVADKKNFETYIDEAVRKSDEFELKNVREYQKSYSNLKYLDKFYNVHFDEIKAVCTPTGFEKLDTLLDGGLYEGLYIIGAKGTFGKTSLALQMGDYIAKSNTDVIMFSFETSRDELIAKSISRYTAQMVREKDIPLEIGKDIRHITCKELYNKIKSNEKELIRYACQMYKGIASNIYVYECGNMNALQMQEIIDEHISNTGKLGNNIVVVVDSIQTMYIENSICSCESDNNKMLELKRISREYKIPVIGISLIDENKSYPCDVMIELRLKGEISDSEQYERRIKEEPRLMELRINKNRNGKVCESVEYEYYSKYGLFEESEKNND